MRIAIKEAITECVSAYNSRRRQKIEYTDYIILLMNSITLIISGITYAPAAFVAILLTVSSIMIGIISYISVLERTKKIGILRAPVASRLNISRGFNAETIIEGMAAGVWGVGIARLLIFPLNFSVQSPTKTEELKAVLPWKLAVILLVYPLFRHL